MVSSNFEHPHQLLNCINKGFRRPAAPSLPKQNSLSYLCNVFSGYFKDSITLIQSSFPVHVLICEKVVAKCLGSHINSNNLSNVFQSVHKQFHSTESTLLKCIMISF